MKKILISGALIALLSTSICFADTNIILNGSPVNFNESTGKPFVENNRTLVPMRAVMEQYGCSVSWEQSTKTATITKDGIIVQVPIGASYIIVNGTQVVNDAPAQIIDGKTYLPIRAVLEAVGADVSWDNESGSVVVSENIDLVTSDNLANIATDTIIINEWKIKYDKDMTEKTGHDYYCGYYNGNINKEELIKQLKNTTDEEIILKFTDIAKQTTESLNNLNRARGTFKFYYNESDDRRDFILGFVYGVPENKILEPYYLDYKCL